MSGKAIIFALILMGILGVGLYVYNSGVIGSGTNNFFSFPTSSLYVGPKIPPRGLYSGGGVYVGPDMGTVITSASTSSTYINPYDIPTGFTAAQISPYFHQVRLGGISYGYSFGSYGQISLSAYPRDQKSSIDVTGWQIKSNRGGEYIPQAVNSYDPSGLAPQSDIRLASGDYLSLYSSSAPVNFRLNKCMGYLAKTLVTNPPISQSCPYVDRSEIQGMTGACQNYLLSIGGSCQVPNLNTALVANNDYNCLSYLNTHFSYRSCFDEHAADADFLSHEIRVWMGGNAIDPFHDRVLLLDRSGLLVDMYTY